MTYAQIQALGASPNPRIIKASDNGYVCHIPAGETGASLTVISTPNVIEVDYIQTADLSGTTIPPFCFGRKGDLPYFGNNPLLSVTEHAVLAVAVIPSVSGITDFFQVSIAEDLMRKDVIIRAKIKFFMQPPTTGTVKDLYLWMDFIGDKRSGQTTGSYCLLYGGTYDYAQFEMDGFIQFQEAASEEGDLNYLAPLFYGLTPPKIIVGNVSDSIGDPLKAKLMNPAVEFGAASYGTAPPNVANSLVFGIADIAGNSVGESVSVCGIVALGGAVFDS